MKTVVKMIDSMNISNIGLPFFAGGVSMLVVYLGIGSKRISAILMEHRKRLPDYDDSRPYYVAMDGDKILGVEKVENSSCFSGNSIIATWLDRSDDLVIKSYSEYDFHTYVIKTPLFAYNPEMPYYLNLKGGDVKSFIKIDSQVELDDYRENNLYLLNGEYQTVALRQKSSLVVSTPDENKLEN